MTSTARARLALERRRRTMVRRGTQRSASSIVCRLALILAMICGFTALLAGFGTRVGWWRYRTGFDLLTWAAYGGLASAILGAVGAVTAIQRRRARRAMYAIAAIVIGVGIVWVPWGYKQAAQELPAIHDITTDMDDPPQYVAVLPFRQGAVNTLDYAGREIATQQRNAYPDIQPVILPLPPDRAYARALDVVKALRWHIVVANAAERRIEATDTTFWFGFIDDIAVRVRPDGDGSRVDIRSVSRVGRSDVGTNAKRIRSYIAALKGS